jgi:hypothetical protein
VPRILGDLLATLILGIGGGVALGLLLVAARLVGS